MITGESDERLRRVRDGETTVEIQLQFAFKIWYEGAYQNVRKIERRVLDHRRRAWEGRLWLTK